jgi:hypothetical protein
MSKVGARLARLERSFAGGSCGPGCPPQVLVHYEQDGPDAEPVLCGEPEPAAPCPRCGRPAKVVEMLICYDPNFYGNAERLRDL